MSANIERISNDLANVNTDAYKRGRTEFKDLMYETITEPGGAQGAASQSPVGIQRGTTGRHEVIERGLAVIAPLLDWSPVILAVTAVRRLISFT